MFDAIAPRYDLLNHVLSAGLDRRWRDRAVDRLKWRETMGAWQKASAKALKGHPWAAASSAAIIDDVRGGAANDKRTSR